MSKKNFLISSSGLKNIIFTRKGELFRELNKKDNQHNKYEDDYFRFIFGEEEIEMPRMLAKFISPRVSHIHRADPTIDFLQIDPFFINEKEKESKNQIKNLFFNLKQICSGLSIDIDEEMSENLKIFAILNWNEELFNEMSKLFPTNEDQKENQKEKINKYIQYLFNINKSEESYIKYSNNFKQSLIDYLSSHFYLIDKKQIFTFNRYDFYLIISNNKLKINDEDSLYDIINEFYSIQNDEENIIQKIQLYEI